MLAMLCFYAAMGAAIHCTNPAPQMVVQRHMGRIAHEAAKAGLRGPFIMSETDTRWNTPRAGGVPARSQVPVTYHVIVCRL